MVVDYKYKENPDTPIKGDPRGDRSHLCIVEDGYGIMWLAWYFKEGYWVEYRFQDKLEDDIVRWSYVNH